MPSPLPKPLPEECRKAEKILKSFVEPSRNGLDGVIPKQVLAQARGFVIFTVVKAGFVFSARAGSGIVIARLADGTWSAPSAIGTAGLGFGGQAGAEMTEFLIVLNSNAAIRSFMSAGSLTIGGNLSVAVGPLGRNGELSGSLNTKGKVAAMYSYSKTKGLFGGISVEGSVIVERQDANALAYDDGVTSKMILTGQISSPRWATSLTQTLDNATGVLPNWVKDAPTNHDSGNWQSRYVFDGIQSYPTSGSVSSNTSSKKSFGSSWGRKKRSTSNASSYLSSSERKKGYDDIEDDWTSSASKSQSNKLSKPAPLISNNDPFRGDTFPDSDGAWVPNHNRADSAPAQFATHFDSDYVPNQDTSLEKSALHHRFKSMSVNDTASYRPNSSMGGGSQYDSYDPFAEARQETPPPFSQYRSQSRNSSSYGYGRTSTPPLSSSASSRISSPALISPSSATFSSQPIRPLSTKPGLKDPLKDIGEGRAIALFDYRAQQNGDLSFSKGDVIVILKKSNNTDDWWTGKTASSQGIFPANFVEVV